MPPLMIVPESLLRGKDSGYDIELFGHIFTDLA
jgi:hypothetical protein